MRKDFWVLALLTVSIFALWCKALFNFFAQDDFILINHFSQNNFLQNIENVFGPPTVTHWRPIHNLYFLVAGNIFDKNYFGYHVLTLLFHIGASFLIYKIIQKLVKNFWAALIGGLVYGIHPAHFVSLFWISGGATVIGFFFLIGSIYSFLLDRKALSLILYLLALLSSEAMVVGLILFYCINILKQRRDSSKNFLIALSVITVMFGLIRFLFLASKTTFNIYQIELSTKTISAVKYYLLKIAGFAEVSGDQLTSLILLGWLVLIALLLVKRLNKERDIRQLILSIAIIIIGLFPFILIPEHLSPHYMNVSIFGFAIMIGLVLKQLRPVVSFVFLLFFLGIAIYNINLTKSNNWVVKRANLAKAYIEQIEKDNSPPESEFVFADNKISTSQEAYIALGTGEAIKFWFKDKNYQTCFTFYENCKK